MEDQPAAQGGGAFADKQSGKTAGRRELAGCLDYLRVGDTLVVPSLDRLSRSLQDLIAFVAGLRRRGTGFRSVQRRRRMQPASVRARACRSRFCPDVDTRAYPVSASARFADSCNAEVLAAAEQLKPVTIEALLARSDLEAGTEALLRGWPGTGLGA